MASMREMAARGFGFPFDRLFKKGRFRRKATSVFGGQKPSNQPTVRPVPHEGRRIPSTVPGDSPTALLVPLQIESGPPAMSPKSSFSKPFFAGFSQSPAEMSGQDLIDAVIDGNLSEVQRLVGGNKSIVNWRDYVSACSCCGVTLCGE